MDGIAGPHTLRALGAPRFAPRPHSPRPSHGGSIRASLNRWARHYGVDARLVRALAWMESGFQPGVRSSAGAWGVMQVTPATWAYVQTVLLGFRVPRTADGNIRIGVAYLHHLLRVFGGRTRFAVAAYYAGPAAIRRWGIGRQSGPFVRDVLALVGRV
jgi:soluble lytic murein transglycosylase-like protein